MKKENVRWGIGFKVSLILSIVLFVIFAGLATYDGTKSFSKAINQKTTISTHETTILSKELEAAFTGVYFTTFDLIKIIEYELNLPEQERNRKKIVHYLKMFLKANPSLNALGVFFEPNAFDGADERFANKDFYEADGRFIPYAVKDGSSITVDSATGINDNTKNDWYTKPMQQKKPILIQPYYFEHRGKKMTLTTYALPIFHNNKVVGVIDADIDVTYLQDKLENIEGTNKEKFNILCSDDGIIVANGTNKNTIMENALSFHTDFKEFFDKVKQNKVSETTATLTTSGNKSKFIFIPVNIMGTDSKWAFISINSLNYFTKEAKAGLFQDIIQYIIILIVIILILTIIIQKMVSIPLQKTNEALKNIAQGEGDLTVQLPVKGNDEITQLSIYFNKTIEKIRLAIKSVDSNTNIMMGIGNELASNVTETASSINQISAHIEGVKQQSLTQASSVTETASTIEEIIRTIKQLNKSIDSQAASVAESSSSVEQMVANIQTITQTLEKDHEVIEQLSNATTDGKSTVLNTTEITQKISEDSGSLLEASSVIQHIASQTNLLAMNAAIEAAHAGEAGKGFAVVADEIRKLAEESSAQGKTITVTLKNLSEQIDSLSLSAKVVEEKFNIIYDLSDKAQAMSTQITQAMEEQERGSKEVLLAIKDINAVTIEVKNGSDEMLTGSESVASEMQTLDELTHSLTDNMNEMATGVVQINQAIQEVNNISQKNKNSIDNLSDEVGKFKL